MAKRGSIRGNADGKNGENQSYTVKGRGLVTRVRMVKEVEKTNKHPDHSIYERGGVKYVRALPNNKKGDNVDPC